MRRACARVVGVAQTGYFSAFPPGLVDKKFRVQQNCCCNLNTRTTTPLQSLVIKHIIRRSDQAVEQICSSEKLVYRLVRMLRSEDLDVGIKENIAEIVAKLACKLRLADIPGAAHCISSLLDPRFAKEAAQTSGRNFIGIDWRTLVHGLVILGELASDSENCREIHSTIAPVSNGLRMVIKDDATTVQIVRESLRVVAKLTRGTGECSTKLCHELGLTVK
ncbi:unnamed protein product [Miscanthus lutarioriparius]|uniref:ARM repeat superfamily protein n=1 Tax=Miscanthus lutarioriparius TaxID=422564 RepID=A0A811RFH4_9POAL|nr:unnamed protein product [Miscanthus lutarioriparius]